MDELTAWMLLAIDLGDPEAILGLLWWS